MNALVFYIHKFALLSYILSPIITKQEYTKVELYKYRGIDPDADAGSNADIFISLQTLVYNVTSVCNLLPCYCCSSHTFMYLSYNPIALLALVF